MGEDVGSVVESTAAMSKCGKQGAARIMCLWYISLSMHVLPYHIFIHYRRNIETSFLSMILYVDLSFPDIYQTKVLAQRLLELEINMSKI